MSPQNSEKSHDTVNENENLERRPGRGASDAFFEDPAAGSYVRREQYRVTAAGACTLRAAIQEANASNGAHLVVLPAGVYTLTIAGTGEDSATTGDLDIRQSLTLAGEDMTTTIIDAGALDRVFQIDTAGTGIAVMITGVTIRNGSSDSGGGLRNAGTVTLANVRISANISTRSGGGISNDGTLSLIDVTISGNTANSLFSGASGGGIENQGTLTLTNVTVNSNTATGLIAAGGGISNDGTLSLTNATISGNTARGFVRPSGGGAIHNAGVLAVTNGTIVGNTAGLGGGVNNVTFRSVMLKNTILATNSGGNCSGTLTSAGHNLEDANSCRLTAFGDLTNTNPMLGPLAANGGPTETHMLLLGSSAVDAADDSFCPATDQRGEPRPLDGNGDQIANCDIGAYELRAPLVAAVLPSSRSVQVGSPATAFATIINAGTETATACGISPITSVPAQFDFQTTDPTTNTITGSANTPVDIAPGQAQSFVFAFTLNAPFDPTDVQFSFDCANRDPALPISGVNTLLLSASQVPVPDIVALAATFGGDGVLRIPSSQGFQLFTLATVNVGAGGNITVSADTGGVTLPLNMTICEPAEFCAAPSPVITTQMTANGTSTFAVVVTASGNVPFDPAVNRIFVRFKDGGGVTRGSTSVAVRTQ